MTSELLKVLLLPAVLAGTVTLRVLAGGRAASAAATWLLVAGWLLASVGLTLVARESRPWPLAGYLQNFVAFLGLCAVPFAIAYAVSTWLEARGSSTSVQFGLALGLGLLAIVPAAFIGPFWAMLLRSWLGCNHITYA